MSVDLDAAHQAVGRLQRNAADEAVAQVLGDLEGQRLGELLERDVGVQRVEQLRHGAARELHVDHGAGDTDDPAVGVVLDFFVVSRSAVAVMSSSLPGFLNGSYCAASAKRVGATDDFADFLGDLGLPFPVGLQREVADQVVGVVAGRLHRTPTGRRLRRRGLEQRGEYPGSHIPRAAVIRTASSHPARTRTGCAVRSLPRRTRRTIGAMRSAFAILRHHGLELREDDVQLVDPEDVVGPGLVALVVGARVERVHQVSTQSPARSRRPASRRNRSTTR